MKEPRAVATIHKDPDHKQWGCAMEFYGDFDDECMALMLSALIQGCRTNNPEILKAAFDHADHSSGNLLLMERTDP